MKLAKIVVLCFTLCLMLMQSAMAVRLGGGRSYGMQRSFNKQNYSQSNNYNYQRQAQPTMAPQAGTQNSMAGGMHPGVAGALGVAAGAAGGYMLGKSMSNNGNNTNAGGESNAAVAAQAQNAQQANTQAAPSTMLGNEHNIPWGTIAILGALLFLGLMLFRKGKANPGFGNFNNANNNQTRGGANSFFNMGNSNKGNNTQNFMMPNNNAQNGQQNTWQAANAANTDSQQPVVLDMKSDPMEKMPDGVEIVYFLRQAKGMFLHIQSMNNQDNVDEISKYMTNELYLAMRDVIANNPCVADFNNLDCQLVNCEVNQENQQLIASVKFFGFVSEDPKTPPVKFSEIWNFVKADVSSSNKWVIAGIQQDGNTKN